MNPKHPMVHVIWSLKFHQDQEETVAGILLTDTGTVMPMPLVSLYFHWRTPCKYPELSTDGYFASYTGVNQRPFFPGLENTHLNRNVRPHLSTVDSDIRASTTIDGTSTPVSRIFDRLRNISTEVSQNVTQNVTLQPPFGTGAGTTVALNDNPLSVRRRLTTGAAIVYANVSSAPSSDGHHLDPDVFRNRRMTDDSQTMPLRQITLETTIPVQLEYADASCNTCTQVVSAPINRNSLWQHVKNRCVKPQVINLPHIRQETSDLTVGHQHVASKTDA
uniref:Uncharacterized protein n=1 Tax=Tanacetum cinerariifolium TaxID=118510 RepID=A0A6L2NZY8_TANCI|nr:hypothetical protein [Tanacetum cinerariifolium]GEV25821.1 hypothetical protein [Tanacetum cinerariifolium]